jgi:hypothetical protein
VDNRWSRSASRPVACVVPVASARRPRRPFRPAFRQVVGMMVAD